MYSREVCITIEYLQNLEKSINVTQLEQWSYSKWATKEILARLFKNERISPYAVIDDFIDAMNKYSSDGKHSYLFSVAKDVAEDIKYLWLKGE